MSIFKCINEGTDTRKLRWIVCPLQNLLSFKSIASTDWFFKRQGKFFKDFVFQYSYISTGFGWPLYFVKQWYVGPPLNDYPGYWRLLRFGWRYDVNWGGYIFPTAAFKKVDRPLEKGF